MECLLPEGWQRIGDKELVAHIYTVPVYRSVLACPWCLATDLAQPGTQHDIMDSEIPIVKLVQDSL